jgi:RNA polymerase sigma-70 factor (ECF subfamily)
LDESQLREIDLGLPQVQTGKEVDVAGLQAKRDPVSDPNSTASTLLREAKERTGDAWRELVERYSWLVFQWSRNAGLSAHDAGDVVQSVLAQVATYLPSFQKDGGKGSFRRWLRTITRTKIADFRRADGNQPHGEGGSDAHRRLLAIPDGMESSLAENSNERQRQEALWQLVDRLEDEFEESTWQAFWLTVVEGRSTSEAAACLQKSPNAVRIAKWRVLTRLREEAGARPADRRESPLPG